MVKIYNSDIKTNELKIIKSIENGCWISMINPTEEEIKKVCKKVKINEEFIKYPLDYEEKAKLNSKN